MSKRALLSSNTDSFEDVTDEEYEAWCQRDKNIDVFLEHLCDKYDINMDHVLSLVFEEVRLRHLELLTDTMCLDDEDDNKNLNTSELQTTDSIMDNKLDSKVQCTAINKSNRKQCTNFTNNPNHLCHKHNQQPVEPPAPSYTDPYKLKPDMLLLRKRGDGLVLWPGTDYVVRSLKETYVVRKMVDKNVVELQQQDIDYLVQQGIPYKLGVDLSFKGERGPSPEELQAILREEHELYFGKN